MEWNVVCDECGFKIKASQSLKRWDDAIVCKSCFEHRHPQEFPYSVVDDQSVPFVRDPDDDFVTVCTLTGRSAVAGYAVAGCSINGVDLEDDLGGLIYG